jgi:hypothetical protein
MQTIRVESAANASLRRETMRTGTCPRSAANAMPLHIAKQCTPPSNAIKKTLTSAATFIFLTLF